MSGSRRVKKDMVMLDLQLVLPIVQSIIWPKKVEVISVNIRIQSRRLRHL